MKLDIMKIIINIAPRSFKCFITYNAENPNKKPLKKTIAPEAKKQKYVKPDININNKCLMSLFEASKATIK